MSPVQSRPLSAPAQSHSSPVVQSPKLAGNVARPAQTVAGWSAEGGTPISVAQGESAELLAKRYGIPTDALVRANGFTSAAQIQPGSRIVIPVYNASLAASSGARVAETVANAPAPVRSAAGQVKLLKGAAPAIAAAPAALAPAAKVAAAPVKAAPAPKAVIAHADAKPAQKAAVAVSETHPVEPARKTASIVKEQQAPAKSRPEGSKPEALKPEKTETAMAEPKAAPDAPENKGAASTDPANPEFRWPARGRIIQAFKPGGNDGINIAVPEGTSVKAAESGVVAYAGSELKGYGNLILIRHPNGFVSAYANNGDIEVKRGETVKRGQTIAKSGQSGNVASPQLHFELRKGATPVDPTQYLAGL
ncbi:peptidoglycan DD-metalloendopeptidase family protein [Methylocapsa palsarum]|uniref:peptidoglycan DD-metalloendopeptidase family protein n=1 Tax=Methylocapsa palsarum TaxID=1612308 RepID=UPI000AE98D35|nr:peptidoglycan DD-metalloendopeptidase family protein [Methylocapsa palsarum]